MDNSNGQELRKDREKPMVDTQLGSGGLGLSSSPTIQLAIHIPSAGGMYTYISRSLGARWGFMSAWVFLIAQPLLLPLVAIVWGPYAESLVQTLTGVDIPWYAYSILGIMLVFSLTYFGIRISTRVGLILGVVEIVIFLALGFTLIAKAGSHNTLSVFKLSAADIPGFKGLSGIFPGLIYAIFAYIGFENAAPLAEETRNPQRNVALAGLGSSLGIGIYYVIITYGATVFFGPNKMASFPAFHGGNPYQALAETVWGGAAFLIAFADTRA